jgi:hypothetical protein
MAELDRKNPQLWDTTGVTVGGALGDLSNDFMEYYPVYRTAAGTGCGMAFASWS